MIPKAFGLPLRAGRSAAAKMADRQGPKGGSQKGIWCLLPAGLGVPKKSLERFECLRPGNRPVPSAIARRQEQAVDAKIFAETPSAGSSAL